MNKRGDISIVVLVLLTFLLCGSTLLYFSFNKNKVVSYVGDASAIDEVRIQEREARFYLRQVAERAIIESYIFAAKDVKSYSAEGAFSKLVLEKIKELIAKDTSSDEIVDRIRKSTANNGISVKMEGDKVFVSLENVVFYASSNEGRIQASYIPKILVDVGLTDMGLYDLKKVDSYYNNVCKKSLWTFFSCMTTEFVLYDFVQRECDSNGNACKNFLVTKAAFFVENELKQIEINLQ